MGDEIIYEAICGERLTDPAKLSEEIAVGIAEIDEARKAFAALQAPVATARRSGRHTTRRPEPTEPATVEIAIVKVDA